MIKKILIGMIVVMILIQFIRPSKNTSNAVTKNDITVLYTVPDSVQLVLQKACYDCHSSNTRYPWYFNIQPVAWWMNDHISEAKEDLNFSDFGSRPVAKQIKKLKKTAHEVEEGEMPLNSYTWMHKDAILTEREKNILISWANNLAGEIAIKNGLQTASK